MGYGPSRTGRSRRSTPRSDWRWSPPSFRTCHACPAPWAPLYGRRWGRLGGAGGAWGGMWKACMERDEMVCRLLVWEKGFVRTFVYFCSEGCLKGNSECRRAQTLGRGIFGKRNGIFCKNHDEPSHNPLALHSPPKNQKNKIKNKKNHSSECRRRHRLCLYPTAKKDIGALQLPPLPFFLCSSPCYAHPQGCTHPPLPFLSSPLLKATSLSS